MRIGVLVAKLEDGTFEVIGTPGNVDELNQQMSALVDGKVKIAKGKPRPIKLWLCDASRNPLKAKKVAG